MSKRKALSVDEKVKILRELDDGVKNAEICKRYGLSSSTVSTLLKNKGKLMDAYVQSKTDCKRLKKCSKEDLDEALLKWMKVQRSADLPVSGPILKVQAEKFAEQFGYSEFVCSNGWIDRFKVRHGITFGKICGEAKSANMADIAKWLSEKWPGIREGYAADDIYNADETGIFYNVTPQYILKFKGEKCVGGKLSKNRLTALVCSNMSGTNKKKLFIIGKSKNPRCFKNVKKLPVDYDHSRKAWMTSDIFTKFISKWERQLRRENRKIILLIDNCSAHPEITGLTNIRIEFLPPNSTSVIQPMDQGIIRSFKCHFRKQLILMILDRRDRSGTTSNTNVNVLEAIRLMNDAWENVTSTCIIKCFHKAGLDSCQDDQSTEEEEVENFIQTANLEMTEEEFQNYVSIDDELMTSDVPTTEDIVADVLANSAEKHDDSDEDTDEYEESEPPPTCSTMLEFAEKMQTFFEARDVSDDVFRAMSLLRRTIAQERDKERVQRKLTNYFKYVD
ncbi:tigger transposable element-derived protein 4-like [Parasteatoda tepidariorum]|uniref:tigger transposable element-derived protein 4-like n=1 Tax=Parasteatoda tepidariorum TaxID=114398 RepID=UPI0039BCF444